METEQPSSPQRNENIISQLWAKYFPYWPIFLLLVAIFISGAWISLKYKLPVYESRASILIKDEKKGIEDSKVLESINPLAGKKIIENEIEVIKSRALMSQVVKELRLYTEIFQTGKWKNIPIYNLSPVRIEAQSPDSLIGVQRVDFSFDQKAGVIRVNGRAWLLNQWIATPWGRLKFTVNNPNYQPTSKLYFSLIHPKIAVQHIQSRLEVTPVSKISSVVNLQFKDEVPKRAEDVLNALIGVYEKAAINDKNALAQNTLTFLDERLAFVSRDLDSIEKALQQYKAKRGAIDLSSKGHLFLANVSENDQKLSEVNMKLSVLGQIEDYLNSNNSRGSLVPSTLGVNDPLLTSLLNKLYDAELSYEKLKATTGENNPELSSLSDQIQKMRPSILENVRNQYRSLEATKANLYRTNTGYNALLSALPQQERDLVEISREQNIKSSIYSFLLQKREETALSNSATVSDSRVIDRAESSINPVGLDAKMIYTIASLLALGFGVLLISAREMFNRKVLFRKEIEAVTSFPIIGEIQYDKSKSKMVIGDGKSNFVAEEFRMLRTSLHYLKLGSKAKKILITSTVSGDGKSFVAANLAKSIAISGKKTILVEFDLNNPTLSDKLGMPEGIGVADYLASEADAEDVIRNASDSENLFVITAGNLPSNPSELILNERALELLNYLEARYDYVLLDSAPVGILSDGYVLSRYCDATLYVVRHGHTPKRMLERLEENNKINELKNMALVFNGVQSRGFGKYGYGYGYVYNQTGKKKNY